MALTTQSHGNATIDCYGEYQLEYNIYKKRFVKVEASIKLVRYVTMFIYTYVNRALPAVFSSLIAIGCF